METQDNRSYRAYLDEIGDDLKVTLARGLEFIGWDKQIDSNTRVFVKPNFTFPRYREGVTTSPQFLRCLLELLKSKADTVIVGESDGGNHSFKAEEAFEGHNMQQLCNDIGVELVSLSSLPAQTIESEVLGKRVKVQLPTMLLEEIDCFVSVPVLKVHVMTGVSLSLKNSWGCIPDTMRGMHHQNISRKLVLIARLLKPKVVVIDGTYALNKHGPMYGEAVKTNLALLADNTVVADALAASLIGFSPQKIEHIELAERAGLGSANLMEIETNKEWQQYRRKFNVERTLVERLSSIPFHSDVLAKLIFDSPLTPLIYRIAGLLRSSAEKELAHELGRGNTLGPY